VYKRCITGKLQVIQTANLESMGIFQKIINQEKNRQLNEFSIIHFKKLESNAIINEK